ncbi:MAG: hypothetical protein FWD35_06035 [Oscillospiraceae bacterium]|nr:hypothetical protein [Oscillospiraceae bacterium]
MKEFTPTATQRKDLAAVMFKKTRSNYMWSFVFIAVGLFFFAFAILFHVIGELGIFGLGVAFVVCGLMVFAGVSNAQAAFDKISEAPCIF